MFKLVALDMDGTLLNNEKKISDNNKEAILKCRSLGVKFVLSTGRPLSGIKKYLDQLGLMEDDNFSVLLNGALVQNNSTGSTCYEEGISYKDLLLIKDFLDENNVSFHIFTDKCVYSETGNLYTEYESRENNMPLIRDSYSKIKDKKILKLVIGEDSVKLDRVEKIIPKEFKDKFTTMRSTPIFFEFLNKKTSKGAGIEFLTNLYGFKRENVICMGDAENDISMLKYAGLPITLSNAFPKVKKLAKYVTRSNQEDGVAEALNKFVLNQV